MQSIYCPNQSCHAAGKIGPHIVKAGTYCRKESVQRLQRYRCRVCLKRFSQRIFTLNYRNRFDFINQRIFQSALTGASNSAIARILGVSEPTIRKRLNRMAAAGWNWMSPLFFDEKEKEKKKKILIDEPIVYDGFESFCESQYFPFHLNFCIGKNSHFIYNLNFTPLNRKGRMTENQKKKREEIYRTRGKIDGKLLENKSLALFPVVQTKISWKFAPCK